MTDDRRNPDGTIKKGHTINKNGRPKNAKGKYAKVKMENLLAKAGPESLQMIMDAAKKLMEQGQLSAGAKLLIPVLDKWYSLTIYNDKIQIAEEKGKKAQDEDDEESFEGNVFQVSFSSTAQ